MAETVMMASSSSQLEECRTTLIPQVRLKLRKPRKKVAWSTETVDNEHMNKKKSKCCCIYEKPRQFGESSSEEEDECDHCRGHVERRRAKPRDEAPVTESIPMHQGDDSAYGSQPT